MWKKIPERTFLLELAKIGGMIFWFLTSFLIAMLSPKVTQPTNKILILGLLESISCYLVVSLLFVVLSYIKKKIRSKRNLFFFLLPLLFMFSSSWEILNTLLNSILTKEFVIIEKNFLIYSIYYITPIIAFTGLYFMINHWLNYKKQKEMTLMATNLANESQLQMLRYQINPHFLFNSLNTIRSMIEADKTIARKMVTELSNFFRYSLSQNNDNDTFENEINAIKNYLEIQKIRFEEKLIIIYDIDDKAYKIKFPFFIVLPLVENAIKYGLQTSKMPLTIKINAHLDEHLEISVQNTGKLVSAPIGEESTKTGTDNIKKRLDLCYSGNYSFSISEKDSWVTAQIIIHNFRNQLSE